MKYLVLCSRVVWRIIAIAVIFIAVVVTLGREFVHTLPNYQTQIDEFISQQLNMRLHSENMQGEWTGFSPSLTVSDLDIFADGVTKPIITTENLKAHPDFLATVVNRSLRWKELSVERLSLSLVEDEDGSWSLAGLPKQQGKTDIDNLLRVLQESTYFKINEAVLQVSFVSGERSIIRLRDALIENSGSFHRLAASVAFEDAPESASLIVESDGDLFDFDDFSGTAYLKLQRLNFQGPVSALLKRWVPAIAEENDFEAAVEAELWLDKPRSKEGRLSGYLKAAEVPLLGMTDAPSILDFSAEVTGAYQPGKEWNLMLQDIDFTWSEFDVEPLTIGYRQQIGDPLGFGTVSVDHLNLTTLSELLVANLLLPEKGIEVLQALQPKGNLTAIHLHIQQGEKITVDEGVKRAKPKVMFQANLHDVAIASWNKTPASRKINGYLQMQGTDGLLELDSPDGFEMLYPTVYDSYMVHPSAKGQFRWRIDKPSRSVRVSSGPIEIKGEQGNGAAYLYLDIPMNRQDGPGDMFLQVGMRDSHSRYRNQFIPKTLPQQLSDWLDTAVGDSRLNEVGFIWRGTLSKTEHEKRSVQLYLDIEDGNLKFHPDWPEITDLDAMLTVDGSDVTATVNGGQIGDLTIAEARLFADSKPDQSPTLYIDGEAYGDAGEAVRVLAQSPLKSRVDALQSWPLQGNARAELNLEIPLQSDAAEASIEVNAQISDATLASPNGDFVFEGVAGRLSYRDETGLTGTDMRASLWGDNPLSGQLKSVEEAVVISVEGDINTTQLLEKAELPLTKLIAGDTRYQAELSLAPDQQPTLSITSDLIGVGLDLPEPFGKKPEVESDLALAITFQEQGLLFTGEHRQQLHFAFNVAEEGLDRGVLSINKPVIMDEGHQGLLLDGVVHDFTLDEWLPVYDKLAGFWETAESTLEEKNLEAGPPEADPLSDTYALNDTPPLSDAPPVVVSTQVRLKLDNFNLEKLTLHDVAATGGVNEQGNWQFSFVSDKASGDVILPAEEDQPIGLDLQTVTLDEPAKPESEQQASKRSLFADINPSELPHVDLRIEQLTVGDMPYGSIAFVIQPLANGVELQNIRGDFFDLTLGDVSEPGEQDSEIKPEADDNKSVHLIWIKEGEYQQTHFSGLVGAGDIAKPLANVDTPKIIESKQASFLVDFTWSGAPDEINRDSLSGSLLLELQDGEFFRTPKGASDALIRGIGLFNFANWVRRLKLDFSDLFAKGMIYDNVSGGLKFDQGVMVFDEPIVVEMPSGRMRLSGSADLLGEQLDAHIVMTVPVGTNLPWVVALAGGLPAAAGVFITSKLFEKQLDKLSSLSYKVTGTWDDPTIKVDRVFSDKGAEIAEKTVETGEQSAKVDGLGSDTDQSKINDVVAEKTDPSGENPSPYQLTQPETAESIQVEPERQLEPEREAQSQLQEAVDE